jgi:DNA-binding NarL/FixJ family response regulator
MSQGQITAMLVDGHAVVRRGLTAFLHEVPGIEVVQEENDGQRALHRVAALHAAGQAPDVVLVDLVLPSLDGLELTRRITERFPDVRGVVLTSFGELERIRSALAAGAVGYVLKNAEANEIVHAVKAAASGEVYLDPQVARRLTQSLFGPTAGVSELTPRERDILALIANGYSNRQIASELRIKERTARTHVSNVLAKLRLTSRTQAALVAIRDGLVPAPGSGLAQQ